MPGAQTRPRSLRPRSTSMTCSARSFGSASSSAASRASSSRGAPARPGAGDRVQPWPAARHLDERLRRGADDVEAVEAEQVHVRAGVGRAQHPVDVQRVAAQSASRSAGDGTIWKASPARMSSLSRLAPPPGSPRAGAGRRGGRPRQRRGRARRRRRATAGRGRRSSRRAGRRRPRRPRRRPLRRVVVVEALATAGTEPVVSGRARPGRWQQHASARAGRRSSAAGRPSRSSRRTMS